MYAQCCGTEREEFEGRGYKSSLILFIREINRSDDDEKCKKSGEKKKGEELQKLRTETTVSH